MGEEGMVERRRHTWSHAAEGRYPRHCTTCGRDEDKMSGSQGDPRPGAPERAAEPADPRQADIFAKTDGGWVSLSGPGTWRLGEAIKAVIEGTAAIVPADLVYPKHWLWGAPKDD